MTDVPLDVIDSLRNVVGAGHVLTEPDMVAGYVNDWTGRYRGSSAAVVRPGSIDEVVDVMQVCATHRIPVVPQGGNTSLVASAVPLDGEVVLSLRRLDGLRIDGEFIRAEAGATLAGVQALARAAGHDFGVDIASRDSATIGGMISTNAGGLQMVRHGRMGEHVVSVTAVTGEGELVEGEALTNSMIGAEGMVAVIVEARLQMVDAPPNTVATMVGVADAAETCDLVQAIGDLDVRAAEIMFSPCAELVGHHFGQPPPVDSPVILLIEVAETDGTDLATAVGDRPAVVAWDNSDRHRLWLYRDRITEAISARGVPHKCDFFVPVDRLGALVERLGDVLPETVTSLLFGHVSTGFLHLNMLGDDLGDAVDEAVFAAVAEVGGDPLGEHGVGRAKRRFRPDRDRRRLLAAKEAYDPSGLLNARLLDDG